MRRNEFFSIIGLVMATAVLVVTLFALPVSSQIIPYQFQISIAINVSTVTANGGVFGITVVPINSSYVNVTMTAFNYISGQPLNATFAINEVYLENATTGWNYAFIAGWTFNVTGEESAVIPWYTNESANAILWNVNINGQWYPGYLTYYAKFVTVPAISPPSILTTFITFFGLAIFIALAGRHRLRDAGIGALIYGAVVYSVGLIEVGLTNSTLYVVATIAELMGLFMIIASRKVEEQ